VVSLDDAAVLGVHLVGILLLCRIELQNVARLARIAAQLFPGEYDFLRCFVQPRILQGDLLRLLQRDEVRCHNLFLLLLQHDTQHRINAICPLRFCIGKDESIVRRFDAAGNQCFLGKGDFFADPGIVQCDFLRVRQKNEVVSLDDATVLGVHLVGILLLRGVEL